MFGWEWKIRGMEKKNLYKFTHIYLLKNDTQLKQRYENLITSYTKNQLVSWSENKELSSKGRSGHHMLNSQKKKKKHKSDKQEIIIIMTQNY